MVRPLCSVCGGPPPVTIADGVPVCDRCLKEPSGGDAVWLVVIALFMILYTFMAAVAVAAL